MKVRNNRILLRKRLFSLNLATECSNMSVAVYFKFKAVRLCNQISDRQLLYLGWTFVLNLTSYTDFKHRINGVRTLWLSIMWAVAILYLRLCRTNTSQFDLKSTSSDIFND